MSTKIASAGEKDFPKSQGASAVGARLRRLSERIDREAAALYAEIGVDFEQRWFGVLNQLTLAGPLTVGAIAEALGVTHAAVSQTRAALETRGHIESVSDTDDARRRTLRLTPKGRALVTRLAPVFEALAAASRELDAEAGGVLDALNRLEAALDRKSLTVRAEEARRR